MPSEPPTRRDDPILSDVPLVPRRAFFGNPRALNPILSPDGRWLAWLAPVDGVMNLWVAPRDDLAAARPLTRRSDRPIDHHWFARTNAHLLFALDRDGDENFDIWCVGLDGSDPRNLTPCADTMAVLIGMHQDDPVLVAVALNDRDPCWHDLHVIDIVSGERRLVYENLDDISTFVMDGALNLRLATTTFDRDGGLGVLRRDGDGFREIMSIEADDALVTAPLHFNRKGDAWYLRSSVGGDKAALFRVDWTTGARTLVAEDPRADIDEWIVAQETGEVSAVCVEHARKQWIAVGDAVAADLSCLECELGTSFEVVSQSADDSLWIVCAHGPEHPDSWHLLDRRSGRIEMLFGMRPALDGAPLVGMHDIVIEARDGLALVSYLTLPASEGGTRPALPAARPLPMVLLVHGGPWGRDSFGYVPEVQWLANRGYAVLQVNFRGSSGFGKAFALAAEGEWAGKMHDDLVDAVGWAVASGVADPARIAICGSSYGGYAALVGAAFTPDLFCCSVSVAGIADLETMLENGPDYWTAYAELEYRSVGDPRTAQGRALLRARSPIDHVDAITRPILIGHGLNDVRCTLSESDRIVAALQRRAVPVIYVVFPDEGHVFLRPENDLAFRAVMEAFLARCLGGRREPVGDDFQGSSHEIRAGASLLRGLTDMD